MNRRSRLSCPRFLSHAHLSELYKQYIVRTRTAFPDFHATIEEQIAEGDLVVTRWSVQGTHQGMFRGHSPTGKQLSMTGIVIDRIVDGVGYPRSDATAWRDPHGRGSEVVTSLTHSISRRGTRWRDAARFFWLQDVRST